MEDRARAVEASRLQQHGTGKTDESVRNINEESPEGVRAAAVVRHRQRRLVPFGGSASLCEGRKSSSGERPGSDLEILVSL